MQHWKSVAVLIFWVNGNTIWAFCNIFKKLRCTIYDVVSLNRWILDFGCSYHMCPNQKLFTTYRSVEGGTLLMRNNYSWKMVRLGSIRIRMHDGVVWTLRTLTNEIHVPEFKKNLFYVGAFDPGRCKIITWNGEMKVVRGSLEVMKGIFQENIYALLGTTRTESEGWGWVSFWCW